MKSADNLFDKHRHFRHLNYISPQLTHGEEGMLRSLFALTAIMSASLASASSLKPITTKEEYVAKIADKKATADWGWVLVKSDGTLKGKAGSRIMTGKWYWQDKYFCRVLIEADGTEGKEDCSLVFLSGKLLYTHSKKGKGSRRELLLP